VAACVTQTAARLSLDDRLDQLVGELSRGLRQRVAIGQAIIHSPRVLVLDEPASGLDPEARHNLAELFKQLQASGMTLLVSSHILAELEAYAREMLVIRDGRIVEQRTLGARATSQRQILVEVIDKPDKMVEYLATRSEVEEVTVDGNRIVCEVTGGDIAQQILLRDLIKAGTTIVNFSTVERVLQSSYLESIKRSAEP
jgi:ABC-2 type transport system ATP-binding protein